MDKFTGVGNSPFMKRLTYWLILNLGVAMLAVGIYFFQAPNGFAPGGVSGISIILARLCDKFFGLIIPQSVLLTAMNILILIIGVIILGKECGFLTFYCSILYSAF